MLQKNGGNVGVINMSQWLNLDIANFDGVGEFETPEVYPVTECDVTSWIKFNMCGSDRRIPEKKLKTGVHFFQYDYFFERCWSNPDRYGNMLKKYGCVLAPDFSLYTVFPKAMQVWNNYRKHWLARYWQEMGLTVIPNIGWADESSFEWCFDGDPIGSIVAVSNIGCTKDKEVHELFRKGYDEMLRRLQPSLVLCFVRKIYDYPGNVRYIQLERTLTTEDL